MTDEVNHLFRCLLAISWGNISSGLLPIWALRVLYILLHYISPLSDMTYKFVLLFLALSVYFLHDVLWSTKFLILMKSHLSVFPSVAHTFGPITCWVFLIRHFSPWREWHCELLGLAKFWWLVLDSERSFQQEIRGPISFLGGGGYKLTRPPALSLRDLASSGWEQTFNQDYPPWLGQ